MKFEYLIVQTDQAETTPHVQNTFNGYGDDGWELVAMDKKFWVFKREKNEFPDMDYGPEEESIDYSVAE